MRKLNNFKGSIFMTLAVLTFTVEDFFSKATKFCAIGGNTDYLRPSWIYFLLGMFFHFKTKMVYEEAFNPILLVRSLFGVEEYFGNSDSFDAYNKRLCYVASHTAGSCFWSRNIFK